MERFKIIERETKTKAYRNRFIRSILPHVEFVPIDHREDASHFIYKMIKRIKAKKVSLAYQRKWTPLSVKKTIVELGFTKR